MVSSAVEAGVVVVQLKVHEMSGRGRDGVRECFEEAEAIPGDVMVSYRC